MNPKLYPRLTAFLALVLMQISLGAEPTTLPTDRPIRIMAVGDSITEGAGFFEVYRYPLMSKLSAAGYKVEFVGSKKTHPLKDSPFGELHHEGYGGKNIDQVFNQYKQHYPDFPADIVLLHCGHNRSSEENPVPELIKSTREFIRFTREHNPRVIMLVAQVIPSAKLPKYSYIPDFNKALVGLAAELNTPEQPVILVDQEKGFDPEKDTVGDKVHPTAQGAEKMAQKWFEALQKILPQPTQK